MKTKKKSKLKAKKKSLPKPKGKSPESNAGEENEGENSDDEIDDDLEATAVYMKILVNYLQLLAIIGTYNFQWPDMVLLGFEKETEFVAGSTDVFSFDCLLKQPIFTDTLGMRSFFAQLLVTTLAPILMTLAAYLVWLLIFWVKYRKEMYKHRQQFS